MEDKLDFVHPLPPDRAVLDLTEPNIEPMSGAMGPFDGHWLGEGHTEVSSKTTRTCVEAALVG